MVTKRGEQLKAVDSILTAFKEAGILITDDGPIHEKFVQLKEMICWEPPIEGPAPITLNLTHSEASFLKGFVVGKLEDLETGDKERDHALKIHGKIISEDYVPFQTQVAGVEFMRTAPNRISAKGNGTWNISFYFGGSTEEQFKAACARYYHESW